MKDATRNFVQSDSEQSRRSSSVSTVLRPVGIAGCRFGLKAYFSRVWVLVVSIVDVFPV